MTTALQLVTRSLRICKVIDAAQAPSSLDYETAQTALNAMLTRWEATGLAMGWQNVDNPSDALPLPPEAEECVAYQLAKRIAVEYGVMLSPDVEQMASDFMNDLLRDRAVEMPIEPKLDVPWPDRYYYGYGFGWNNW